jgi:hypothetical protein
MRNGAHMKTRWSFLILGSLIFLGQSDGMARSYSTHNGYGSTHHRWHSAYSSGNTEGTSPTATNSPVGTGVSSTDAACDGTNAASHSCNTAQTIIDDMTGTPSIPPPSWTNGWPHVSAGINAPSWANSITAWGAIYRFGNDTNTAVEARNIRTYILRKSTRQWELFDGTTDVGYSGYKLDFSGFASLADERIADDGGVIVRIPDNVVFHFWPSGNQNTIDTSDIAEIFTTFEARLVVNDSSKPDDTQSSIYVGEAGADYYGNGECCFEDGGEIGNGRFKYVTTEWAWYNMMTLPTNATVATVAANNPPLECD